MSDPLRAGFDLTIAVGPGFIRLYNIVSRFESRSKGERYRFSRFKSIPALLKNASYRSYLVVQKARPDIIKSGQPVKISRFRRLPAGLASF
ncbi:hypothetical protein G9G63_07170 [Paenibacillus sp. EKM202P]|uniref:hypothetical protein n=1 Tax=unclassified Paenibacillus TaxID=185978 RepID=UPI0013EDEA14|nr:MULTISPECIES: hypothetical protein [unclassified Paenibacillus]KAF6565940.1 hypothetical protein G9G63_07170 [Paenibacillus sp. EKM202P]KAF6572636.1 hypothetical protein G9G64_03105 [Paenibacillus sp. EKM207P]